MGVILLRGEVYLGSHEAKAEENRTAKKQFLTTLIFVSESNSAVPKTRITSYASQLNKLINSLTLKTTLEYLAGAVA